MKGIILAGGSGSRLWPITKAISKQLIPVYDKPMIYYPLSTLMLAGISRILIISTNHDLPNFKNLLGDGSKFGIQLSYAIQNKPEGLAQAFLIGEKFIGNDDVCLILGDNIFYGNGLQNLLMDAYKKTKQKNYATIFGYYVSDPERYGIVESDKDGNVISVEEKPKNPKSNFAIVGLYFYPNSVINIAKKIKPSKRGELEITSVNDEYLNKNKLSLIKLGRGFTWYDTGTQESLLNASNFIHNVEKRQGLKVSCLEIIGYIKGFISYDDVLEKSKDIKNSKYREYIINRLEALKR